MTISLPDVLHGVQTPRLSNFPEGAGSDGPLTVELMESAGVDLDDWQKLVLDRMLRYRPDGKWACPTCLLIVPRQNGKGEILIARMLAGLFLFGEELITYTAHEFKTATEHFRRIAFLIETTPELESKVKSIHYANGKESIELEPTPQTPAGQRLRFLARSKKSGRGFTGDCVILDEAYELPEEAMDALVSTMSARSDKTAAGPQLWYSSSAGTETSLQLRRVREKAPGSPNIGYAEWSAEDPDDPEALAQANPGLGIRISREFIDDVERDALSEEGFNRERLGIWHSGPLERVFPDDVWQAVRTGKNLAGRPRFGVDVLPDRSRAAITACAGDTIEVTGTTKAGYDHRPGTGWIVARVKELVDRWGGVAVIDGGGPAASIGDELEAEGVTVERMGHAQLSAACARIHDAIFNKTVKFVPAVPLDEAVVGLVKHEAGDRFVWSRSKSHTDITPFNAATLAFGSTAAEPPAPRLVNLSEV